MVVAETNSKDYSDGGWPGTNTLGHALVTFDTLGRVMAQPRVLAAMVWTTRWMDDGEGKNSQWYALGPGNETRPTGRAIALWGQFVQSEMLAVSGGNGSVSGYASRSTDGRTLEGSFDPGGNIPFWVSNMVITQTPFKIMHALRERVLSDKPLNK